MGDFVEFGQALKWLRSYDPPTFARNGLHMENAPASNGSATGPGFYIADRTYADLNRGHWSNALSDVSVSRGPGDSAFLEAVGRIDPLDDHLRPDDTPCPRLRVEVRAPCPDAPANENDTPAEFYRPGVENPGQPDLDRVLVPAGTPTAGRICFYGNTAKPYSQRILDAPAAAAMAQAARQVHLDHDDYTGPYTGLGTEEPGAVVLALEYPGRPDVDVQADSRAGLGHVTNGHIEAEGSPWGDSGFTCLLIRATPNPPPSVAVFCPAPGAVG